MKGVGILGRPRAGASRSPLEINRTRVDAMRSAAVRSSARPPEVHPSS